eukprot:m.77911 g.77911  ORF g.77911 m.77911 type:complete len:78 (+) comp14088_c0_seq1:1443-1676(+)
MFKNHPYPSSTVVPLLCQVVFLFCLCLFSFVAWHLFLRKHKNTPHVEWCAMTIVRLLFGVYTSHHCFSNLHTARFKL